MLLLQALEANKILAASLYGANMTVHLVHKTQDVNQYCSSRPRNTYCYRKITLRQKVNEDGTYTEDGNAFASAV